MFLLGSNEFLLSASIQSPNCRVILVSSAMRPKIEMYICWKAEKEEEEEEDRGEREETSFPSCKLPNLLLANVPKRGED